MAAISRAAAVWDCGIDGVETDLPLCLAHGASAAAAIPAVPARGHGDKWHGDKKKRGEEKEEDRKKWFCFKKAKKKKKMKHTHTQTTNLTESLRIQPAGLHCPNVHNALSLSGVLSHSHSLRSNPRCH